MLDFLRYKSSPCDDPAAEDIANVVENSWLTLLALQKHGGRFGEARTCLYLSQLYFVRWQRQAMRDAKRDLDKYEHDLAEYRGRFDQLKAAQSKYTEDKRDYDCGKTKNVEAQRSFFRELEERWERLEGQRADLNIIARKLRGRKEELLTRYDALRSGMLTASVQPAAVPSASSASPEAEPKTIETADYWASRAADILEKSPLYPNLQYITLCHRASVLSVRAKWDPAQADKARTCLEEAVSLLERPRLGLSEGDVARAEFLSQYTQAFDQLIEWHYMRGENVEALAYAELCRNRTLLDWIHSKGEDAQRQATDGELEGAFQDTTRLARELERMDVDTGARAEKLKDFKHAEERYEKRQREILKKTMPEQAGFGEVLSKGDVEKFLHDRIRYKKELVIYYHVGASNSYLFVLGLDPTPQVIPLKSEELSTDPMPHVSAARVEAWVKEYLDLFSVPRAFPKALTSQRKRTRLVSITERLLPAEVREKLAEKMQRDQLPLIVSPAGWLQQIPFDALVVKDGDRQQFLIDYLPPTGITYIPSLKILDVLEQAPQQRGGPSVVTVACGEFSNQRTARLADLPWAIKESHAVASAFAGGEVCALLDDQATKGRFCREIASRRPTCVHLATHCVRSRLTESLVFHRGTDANGVSDDGYLTMGDICDLPLAECRLAVLSGCGTNEGSEIRGEMAMSISRAFLVARVRRVVASQWPVADEIGCEQVSSFLAAVARQWKAGQSCNYATAMADARKKLRTHGPADIADDPFYWAPFILIGPTCDAVWPK
jgi:CHAT domain-containing protein